MKILSWNIRQGGGKRTGSILTFLTKTKAEVIVLSEYRNNKHGLVLRKRLLDTGYLYQANSGSKREENAVLIVSTQPFGSRLFHRSYSFGTGVVLADFEVFRLAGVYLPHKKKHRLFGLLHSLAENDDALIIAGDYNSGINHVDQKGSSFWYEEDLKKLSQLGMVDAFRSLHGDVKEYSWYSHGGNGFRYDHTFISNGLTAVIKSCRYIHSVREEGLSDHSAMLLTIG